MKAERDQMPSLRDVVSRLDSLQERRLITDHMIGGHQKQDRLGILPNDCQRRYGRSRRGVPARRFQKNVFWLNSDRPHLLCHQKTMLGMADN
jgi:hypothetical protein